MGKRKKDALNADYIEHYYAFVESVNFIEQDGQLRRTYVLDAITVTEQDNENRDVLSEEGLAIMTIENVTEEEIWQNWAPINTEGLWFDVKIGCQKNRPIISRLNATNAYSSPAEQFNLLSFRLLKTEEVDEKRLRTTLSQTPLARWNREPGSSQSYWNTGRASYQVRVLDVGQASCAAIHSGSKMKSGPVIGYYDVGAPMYFHMHGFPKAFKEKSKVPAAGTGFVILSHWDFDHYSLAVTKLQQLQKLSWYAPFQNVGKNCKRLQNLIGSNLNFINAPNFGVGPELLLFRGTGNWNDRNNNGYALRVGTLDEAYLLAGDVGYSYLCPFATMNLKGLAVTHHGGNGAANPPPPMKKGQIAAVSYGAKNSYGHPSPSALKEHTSLGWKVTRTAGPNRGDRWL